jgi:hypothetical protein
MFFFLVALFLAPLYLARAEQLSSSGYAIPWHTMDGGGGYSQGGSYTLQGAIGQPDAGNVQGGNYTLAGGYWPASKQWQRQFLPGILNSP